MIYSICKQLGIEVQHIDIIESNFKWFCDGFKVKTPNELYISYVAKDDIQKFYLKKYMECENNRSSALEYEGFFNECQYALYNNSHLDLENSFDYLETEKREFPVTPELISQVLTGFLDSFPEQSRAQIKKLPEFIQLENKIGQLKNIVIRTEMLNRHINDLMEYDLLRECQPFGYIQYLNFINGTIGKADVPYFDLQEVKHDLISKANTIVASKYQCSLRKIDDQEEIKKYICEVEPNFIYNRFDLRFKKNNFVLEVMREDSTHYYVPLHIDGNLCYIGVWLTETKKYELEQIIDFVFGHFPIVYKIRIDYSINYAKGLTLTNHWKMTLPQTEEEFLMSLSKNSRRNPKRYLNRVEKDYMCRVEHISTPDISKEIVAQYFDFKKKTHETNYKMTPKEYIQTYYVTDADLFIIDGKIEAINFLSITGNTAYFENISYNVELKHYYLGTILYYQSIVNLIQKGIKTLYLADGEYEYKKRYSGEGGINQVAYCGIIIRPDTNIIYSVMNLFFTYKDKLFRKMGHIKNLIFNT